MGLNLSHTDEFVPTPSEVKLLEALSSPENRKLNVTELCKVAEISRPTYYESFKKPAFVKLYKEHLLNMIDANIGDVLKATIDFATNDPRAHADRKILLEMGKLYFQKQGIEHSGNVVVINDDLNDDNT